MLCRDWILCLRETANYFVPKQPSECFLNPGCGCSNPGQEPQCEDCPYLEACLSSFKTVKPSGSHFKPHPNR
jgi:hypothetical protein